MIEAISALKSTSQSSGIDGLSSSVSETRFGQGAASVNAPSGVEQPSFSDALANVSMEAIDRLKSGEAAAISGISGQTSAQHVVEAVMAAETTLQSALAIRDKVVAAYQEISRMQI